MNIKRRQLEALRLGRGRRLFSPSVQEMLERSDRWSRRFDCICKAHLYGARFVTVGILIMCANSGKWKTMDAAELWGVVFQTFFAFLAVWKLTEQKDATEKNGQD